VKMLRSLSKRMSSSGRKERKEVRKARQLEFNSLQDQINKDLGGLANSLVNYDVVPDLVPSSRNGTSLFQAKTNGVSESGQELDRTLYEMPMPENVDAMTDLLKLHQDGDKFPYVGIVGSEGETLDARRARMLSLKPSYGTRVLPEIVVSGCPLIDTEGEFSMSSLMKYARELEDSNDQPQGQFPRPVIKKKFQLSKSYVHIKSITGLYTPNMSSTSDFCKLWFVLVDSRLVNVNKSGQSSALVSNQEGVMEMSCDYCVSVSDLDHFFLGYTLEREILKPGHQWGTISFYFNVSESDIPYQSAKKDALAVYRMPITTLTERVTNADKSDISFTSRDVVTMRKMYLRGDIVDVDEPQKARVKKSSYSKSTMRGVDKGEEIDMNGRTGWEHMAGARKKQVDALEASVSADEEGEYNEEDAMARLMNKEKWEMHQEALREMQKGEGKELAKVSSVGSSSDEEPEIMKEMSKTKMETKKGKGKINFLVQDV